MTGTSKASAIARRTRMSSVGAAAVCSARLSMPLRVVERIREPEIDAASGTAFAKTSARSTSCVRRATRTALGSGIMRSSIRASLGRGEKYGFGSSTTRSPRPSSRCLGIDQPLRGTVPFRRHAPPTAHAATPYLRTRAPEGFRTQSPIPRTARERLRSRARASERRRCAGRASRAKPRGDRHLD